MNSMSRILSTLVVLFISVSAFAQDYSSENKKAIKKYEAAEAAYKMRNDAEAIKLVGEALKADPNFLEAYLLKGYIYMDADNYAESRAAFEKVIEINPSFYPNTFYTLGELEMNNGDYADAKKMFGAFVEFRPNSQYADKARLAMENCDFGAWAMANPVPFKPENLGPNINSKFPEYFPCITADDQTLLYTRLINDQQAYGGVQEDFYVSSKQNGEWVMSQNLGTPINSHYNEGAPSISADGQTLIFTACALPDGDYGNNRRGKGSCDLFYTYRLGVRWTKPVNLGGPINSFHWESQPSFSADGQTMYFVRGIRKQGTVTGTGDIYVSRLSPEGYWTTPEKLGQNINTPGHEASVLIHPDGQTLYFSSDGHVGMGGLDIYVSRMDENGEWGKPVNLGYPINTWSDENSLLVSANGEIAFFASDREGGFGDLDLYSFSLPQEFRPQPVTYMKGKVYDIHTKKPLESVFELIDLETGKIMVQSLSNPESGEFLVSLPINRDYALNVSRNGYMFYSENFELQAGTATDPFLKDVPMTPIKIAGENDGGVVLKNVFFDTDKFDLKEKSKVELDKLVKFLKSNPELVIELSGHTDNVGSDSDNQLLSENRAKAVRQYLIDNGIDPKRLKAKGFGEDRPIATNETAEGRAQNRRTEYKVVGIIEVDE